MPAATVPKNALAIGAGYLYYAPLGTALPTNTVAGGIFTDAWPSGWVLFGITKDGHSFNYDLTVDQIEAAEYLDPIVYVTTGRTAGMQFELQQVHATNFGRAMNYPAGVTTSGSGATLKSTFVPASPGSEVRSMIGWEAQDNTERLYMEQAFQIGSLAIARKKGVDNATLPVEFRGEVAASGFPFQYITAGTLRG